MLEHLAHFLLVKMYAPLELSGLFPPRLCNVGGAIAAHCQPDRSDAACRLFEQLADARIIDATFRRHGR